MVSQLDLDNHENLVVTVCMFENSINKQLIGGNNCGHAKPDVSDEKKAVGPYLDKIHYGTIKFNPLSTPHHPVHL